MLHIRCGTDILGKLKEAGLPGEFIQWADALCQGPTPAGLEPDEWRRVRARHAEDYYALPFERGMQFLTKQDHDLETFRRHDKVLLWFEHDLFDQIILIYLLNWFSRQKPRPISLFLICPNHHIGNLSTPELAGLYGTQHQVTDAELALANRAWAAFCASDPLMIEAVIHDGTSALPHLAPALIRYLQEFPSVANGLGRTEQMALDIIASGVTEPIQIFRTLQEREERFWLGDSMFWPYLDKLAASRCPLLKIEGTGAWPSREHATSDRRVFLTARGEAVLCRQADHVDLNGIDRWLGGVHLHGRRSPWRWDEQSKRLAETR